MTDIEKQQAEENFEWWLTEMTARIEDMKEQLPVAILDKLDYSVNSLDILERYLLDTYSKEAFLEDRNKLLYDGIVSYVGETFRENINHSLWSIHYEDEKDAYYGLPAISNAKTRAILMCPHLVVTALFARNKGIFLSTLLKNNM